VTAPYIETHDLPKEQQYAKNQKILLKNEYWPHLAKK
jgi:hypothetical protein